MDSREKTAKMFFRATPEEAWEWKRRAANRNLQMNQMFQEAAELFAAIPDGEADKVRAFIAKLKTPADAKKLTSRAVMAENEEEARIARTVLDLLRAGKEPECSILKTMTTSR